MIYDEMAKIQKEFSDKGGVSPEVIKQYLDGAKIGYDHESLLNDLKASYLIFYDSCLIL